MSTDHQTLSTEEAKLYDRQIRLWGVDAQHKLRSGKLLVVGQLNYLASETLKNLVLAGVGRLTLTDLGVVTEDDVALSFIYSKEDVGQRRGEVVREALTTLNPTVQVDVSNEDIKDILNHYNILLMFSNQRESLTRISKQCHNAGVKFLAAAAFGSYGFYFMDLVSHTYYEDKEVKSASSPAISNGDASGAKKMKVEKVLEFGDMSSFFSKTWKRSEVNLKKQPGLRTLLLLRAILEHVDTGAGVTADSVAQLEERLQDVIDRSVVGADGDGLSLAGAMECAVGELCPTGSVLGAHMAQEVVRVLSQAAKPHDNTVLLDVNTLALHVLKM